MVLSHSRCRSTAIGRDRHHHHDRPGGTDLARIEQSGVRNLLLRRLTGEEYEALSPDLERVAFKRHDVAIHANVPFEHAYFPESGLASVISHTEDGRRLEVGLFGREAMVSSAIVLGADRIPLETFAQIPGTWLHVSADTLRAAMRQHLGLHGRLLRYVQTFLMTVSSTTLFNGAYRVEERLARWLVMTHDRIDGDDLPLTHEFLSLMLGVRRSGVTVAIHTLEGARMIKVNASSGAGGIRLSPYRRCRSRGGQLRPQRGRDLP